MARVNVLCTLSAISFLPSYKILKLFLKFRRIICTLLLCNKKYRLPCPYKRKRAFIIFAIEFSLRKIFSLRKCTHSFARSDDMEIGCTMEH